MGVLGTPFELASQNRFSASNTKRALMKQLLFESSFSASLTVS
jgi:hypothetical protein